jgi:HlyD family secretion protein
MPSPTRPAPARLSAGRRALPWIGLAVLAGLITAGLWPRPLPVEAAAVTRGPLVVTVDDEGMTRVRHRHVVTSPVGGLLRRIDWKAGAEVIAGQTVLAVIESAAGDFLDSRLQAQAEARVRAAGAAREAALAQRDRAAAASRLATTELERSRRLRAERVISAQELDAVQLRAEAATQDLRAAEFAGQVAAFELQQAEAVAARGTPGAPPAPLVITAPVSGRLLRVFQESSRVVPAGFPLLEVGDPTDLEVRIEVLSRDGVAVRPGARVILEQWGGPEPLAARVRLVEPSAFTKISALGVEEQRVYVIADLTDPPERRPTLGDSYRVEARIVVWEGPAVLQVPAGALFRRQGVTQAYVVADGRARLRTITAGRSNGLRTEVVDGLREGEPVIVYPGDQVAEGRTVRTLAVGAP